ncbi:hypothetical protein RFG21_17950, partial [Acinetobacter baumannii]|nr:hypothetical protein [Acinetobacter baumannii]
PSAKGDDKFITTDYLQQCRKDARRGVNLIFSPKDGVFGSTIGQIFDYLRPDFHPNDHDTTEYLEYYKKKLLNEGGAIAPYFVKEFTPPVRAVS